VKTTTKLDTTKPEPLWHALVHDDKLIGSDYLGVTLNSLGELRDKLDITGYRRWCAVELGVGFTPLLEIHEDLNPYREDNIRILYKPEYLNFGGSGKARAVSFMLYYYWKSELLRQINRVTTAGFGNFIRALSALLPHVKPEIVPVAYMADVLVTENQELVDYLRSKGVVINGCEDNRCPTGDMERGKAIANAHIEAETDPGETTLFLDQHGIFKPFDGLLNAAGYYFSLAPEIVHQTHEESDVYYINGEGTRGSLLGVAAALKRRPRTQIIALRQEEGGHLFGLRSLRELGKSESLDKVETLCEDVYEIPDEQVFKTMQELWEAGIPATPSGGGYLRAALRKAEELREEGKAGTIITLLFDSLDYYRSILQVWVPRILHKPLDLDTFESLRSKAWHEREEHVSKLKAGQNRLLSEMISY